MLLDEILRKIGINKRVKDIYLSFDEIKEMSEMGFEIGSYGVTHTLLSRLDKNCKKKELYNSKKLLEEILSKKINSFCYPYGGQKSYNKYTLELLKEVEYHNAMSVEKKDINKEAIKKIYLKFLDMIAIK